MALDQKALSRGCAAQGTELRGAEQLCRAQLDRFMAALGENRSGPLGPGLLASGQIGMIIRQLQAYLGETDAP